MREQLCRVLMNVQIQMPEEAQAATERSEEMGAQRAQAATAKHEEAIDFSHVGRNDPCPCGSGKKYKDCHGRLK